MSLKSQLPLSTMAASHSMQTDAVCEHTAAAALLSFNKLSDPASSSAAEQPSVITSLISLGGARRQRSIMDDTTDHLYDRSFTIMKTLRYASDPTKPHSLEGTIKMRYFRKYFCAMAEPTQFRRFAEVESLYHREDTEDVRWAVTSAQFCDIFWEMLRNNEPVSNYHQLITLIIYMLDTRHDITSLYIICSAIKVHPHTSLYLGVMKALVQPKDDKIIIWDTENTRNYLSMMIRDINRRTIIGFIVLIMNFDITSYVRVFTHVITETSHILQTDAADATFNTAKVNIALLKAIVSYVQEKK